MHHKYLKIIGFFLATLIVIFLAVVYLKPDKYKNISSLNQLDEFDFLNGTQIDTIWKYLQKLSKSIQKIPSFAFF